MSVHYRKLIQNWWTGLNSSKLVAYFDVDFDFPLWFLLLLLEIEAEKTAWTWKLKCRESFHKNDIQSLEVEGKLVTNGGNSPASGELTWSAVGGEGGGETNHFTVMCTLCLSLLIEQEREETGRNWSIQWIFPIEKLFAEHLIGQRRGNDNHK